MLMKAIIIITIVLTGCFESIPNDRIASFFTFMILLIFLICVLSAISNWFKK